MKIKITTDSTADLSEDILQKYDITTIPVSVLAGDISHKDWIEMKPEDVFKFYDKTGKLCTTSAINSEEYTNFFAPYSENFDTVIHIALGSKVSSCFSNAKHAAQNFKNVYIVDSNSVSAGQGIVAMKAAQMLEQELTAEEVYANCKSIADKVDISFVVDTLEFLRKGGRCSALAEFGSNLLKIKPSIQLTDGTLKLSKKYRGTLNRCVENYIQDKFSHNENVDLDTAIIAHSPCNTEIVNLCVDALDKYKKFKNVHITQAGCTVSSHCGPNCIGIIFLNR